MTDGPGEDAVPNPEGVDPDRACSLSPDGEDRSPPDPSGSGWLVGGDWIALGLLVGAAVVVRAVYFVQSQAWPYFDQPVSDAALYLDRARGILGGYWPPGNMAHSQGPLYPYLLAGVLSITGGHRLILILQMVLGCTSVALVYLASRRAGGRTAAVLAALLCLGYGPFLANEGKLLTESIATCLSLLVVYGLIRQTDRLRWSWLVVVGLALGLASDLRPSYLLAVPLVAAWVGWRRRRTGWRAIVPAGVLCVVAAAPVAPFTWQNYRAERVFIPLSSAGGITFFLGNNPMAAGTLSFGGVLTGGVGTQHEEQLSRAEQVLGRKLTSAEASTFWYKRGARFILEHPRWWAWIMWRKVRLHFCSVEVANVYSFYVERSVISVLRLLAVPFGVIGAFGVVGVVLSTRRVEAQPLLILLGVGLLTCMVFYTSSRFRMPTVPLLAVLGGWAVERAIAWWRTGRRARAAAAAASGAVLTVLMVWPVGGPLPSPELFGRRNLASMLARSGEPDRARAILAPQLDPNAHPDDRSEAYLALGRIESGQKRFREAVDALTHALEIDPRNVAPHRELAKAYYHLARYDQAVKHARDLLAQNPRDLECQGLIGQCHMKQRRWADAITALEQVERMAPRNAHLLNLLGQAYAGTHQYRKAIEVFARSVALRPDPPVMLNLAVCYMRINEKEQARELVDRVLDADPDDTKARALIRRLGGRRSR